MKKLTFTALALVMGATQAHAAGYQLNEYSATGLGRAFAGAGVVGDDFSALGYNPAGMTANKNSGVQLGLTFTEIASKAKSEHGTDKMDYFVPLPSFMSQWNVNNKWFIGGITNSQERDFQLKLDFLPEGKEYRMTSFADAVR